MKNCWTLESTASLSTCHLSVLLCFVWVFCLGVLTRPAYGASFYSPPRLGHFTYLRNANINGMVYFINKNNEINVYVDLNNVSIIFFHKKFFSQNMFKKKQLVPIVSKKRHFNKYSYGEVRSPHKGREVPPLCVCNIIILCEELTASFASAATIL